MLVMLRPSPHFRTEPKKEPPLFVVAWSRIRSCYLVLRPSAHRDGVFPDERIVVGYVLKLDYNRSCLAPHEVERITDAVLLWPNSIAPVLAGQIRGKSSNEDGCSSS